MSYFLRENRPKVTLLDQHEPVVPALGLGCVKTLSRAFLMQSGDVDLG